MDPKRISAFSREGKGGNPAGIKITDHLPATHDMQATAREVGYSETAFAAPEENRWRVRYFSPEQEVPFCGHATIALGSELGRLYGAGRYDLVLNEASISVEAIKLDGKNWGAALLSPETQSTLAPDLLQKEILSVFSLIGKDLDLRFPLSIASAGARHIVIGLKDRSILSEMAYDFEALLKIMKRDELTTIALFYIEKPDVVHCRNAFAIGGVYEDPATGAAAAALGGYFRDIGWMTEGSLTLYQGDDMQMPSVISVDIPPKKGQSIRISGETRIIAK